MSARAFGKNRRETAPRRSYCRITIEHAEFFVDACVLDVAVLDSRIVVGHEHFLEKLNGDRALTHTAVTDHHQLVRRQWMVGGLGYSAPMASQLLLRRVREPRRQLVCGQNGENETKNDNSHPHTNGLTWTVARTPVHDAVVLSRETFTDGEFGEFDDSRVRTSDRCRHRPGCLCDRRCRPFKSVSAGRVRGAALNTANDPACCLRDERPLFSSASTGRRRSSYSTRQPDTKRQHDGTADTDARDETKIENGKIGFPFFSSPFLS